MKKNNNEAVAVEANFSAVLPQPISVPSAIDVKGYNGKWVKWGEENKLPNQLYTYFLEVSNLQSILLTYNDYICGNGITTDMERTNSNGESLETTVLKCVMDYIIFGCYAIEVIRNGRGEICDIIYQDVRNVRINEEETKAYLASEWGSFNAKNGTIELPLYNEKEKCDHFIYFYNGGARGWYGCPLYFSALKSIEILRQVRNFHLNNLTNGFSSNVIITFCNGQPSKTVKDEIYKEINEHFCGTDNASRLFINYADNQDSAPKIERLLSDQFGDLYKNLYENSIEDVYTACRINPILLGVNVNTGFSKQEYGDAHNLFNFTVIKPIQRKLEKSFAKLGINFVFNDYKINLD